MGLCASKLPSHRHLKPVLSRAGLLISPFSHQKPELTLPDAQPAVFLRPPTPPPWRLSSPPLPGGLSLRVEATGSDPSLHPCLVSPPLQQFFVLIPSLLLSSRGGYLLARSSPRWMSRSPCLSVSSSGMSAGVAQGSPALVHWCSLSPYRSARHYGEEMSVEQTNRLQRFTCTSVFWGFSTEDFNCSSHS